MKIIKCKILDAIYIKSIDELDYVIESFQRIKLKFTFAVGWLKVFILKLTQPKLELKLGQ